MIVSELIDFLEYVKEIHGDNVDITIMRDNRESHSGCVLTMRTDLVDEPHVIIIEED